MSWKQHSNREWFLEGTLKNICQGKNVWDFCCGSGMNGIDALKWGAAHVTFTDVRKETFQNWINEGHHQDKKYDSSILNKDNHRWQFLDANRILEDLERAIRPGEIDIIIYHGHFYHANNHLDILKAFSKTNAKHIIFETKCMNDSDFRVDWHTETTESQWDAWNSEVDNPRQEVLAGSPTTRACDEFFKHAGYNASTVAKQDWGWEHDPSALCQYRVHYTRPH